MRELIDFRTTYGELMEAWGRLESALFYWFMWTTGLDERMARAVYYSSRSFAGRRNMLKEALLLSKLDAPTRAFVEAALNKASLYSEFRNRATHGEPVWSENLSQYVLSDASWKRGGPGTDTVTIPQMRAATENVNALRTMLWDLPRPLYRVEPDGLRAASPQAYLERIRALPNRASESRTSARTPPNENRPPRKPRG